MKKIFVTIALLMLILVGCGSGESDAIMFNESELLSAEETKEALKNPEDNKGKSVELSGLLFNFIESDDDFVYVQIYQDFENYKNDVALKIPKEIAGDAEEDEFILGQGVILGEMKGENLFGGDLKSAIVEIDNIIIGDFKDTVALNKKEFNIDMSQSQHNHKVVIQKIEFSDYDTRLYVEVENNSNDKVTLSSYDFTLVIGGKNYTEEYSYHGDYEEIDSELNPNTKTEGIIAFPVISYDDIAESKIVVDRPYSDNWDIDFHDYVFDVQFE